MEHSIKEFDFDAYQKAAGVSSSMLKILRESTPLHLMHYMANPPEDTPATRMGRLVHTAILQPELQLFHVKPEGMSFATKDGKAWREEHQDREIITSPEHAAIEGMKASVHAHDTASRLLKNADFERSLFVTDGEGTLRKMRADILPHGGTILPDLKTCTSAHPTEFSKTVASYEYFCQAAYYLQTARLAGKKFNAFAFIAVEKEPPYACAVHFLDIVAIECGNKLNAGALETYRKCQAENRWPGFPGSNTIGLPAWLEKTLSA